MRRLAGTIVAGLIGLGPVQVAQATTITPTVFTDDTTNNGNCTLREAIEASNANAVRDQCPAGSPGSDTIDLAAGTYTLSLPGSGDNLNFNGDLDILSPISIIGEGAAATIIDGNGSVTMERVFDVVAPTGSATISDLTIRHGGDGDDSGAGIRVAIGMTLTLDRVLVMANNAGTGDGGGIDNSGTASLTDSRVAFNLMSDEGGGIFTAIPSVLSLDRVSVDNNRAQRGGGGILTDGNVVTMTNVTISANSAGEDGGGIDALAGTSTLNNVTITGNTADSDADGDGDGGGIRASNTVELKNTIVAGNSDRSPGGDLVHPECSGSTPLTSEGHNLIQNTAGCTINGDTTGNITGQDPALGPLLDNGGPTPTHALLKGSPAIDAGGLDCAPTDQRGLPRNCDIGAYELVLCQKVAVNRIGTEGDDVLDGTTGPDGFLAQGGNDRVKALGGADGACLGGGRDTAAGGGGKDRLNGEAGKDRLNGQGGRDRLRGGPGKDTCIGGTGRDRAACEIEKAVP